MDMYHNIITKLELKWIGDPNYYSEQLDGVVKLLRLGAYSLPKLVINCSPLLMHLGDCLQKDLGRSMDALRKG